MLFIMRNLCRANILEASLKEIRRVLKSSGQVVFLDLTRPSIRLLRWGHNAYLRTVMPLVGRLVCGKGWPGAYLKTSIEDLPSPEQLRVLFERSGFTHFDVRPLWGGVVSLFFARG
jgi:demethylmenaquinone methyltransferase/2-methoxy-6-polyprenyl-1,4-benzoquinol methylase